MKKVKQINNLSIFEHEGVFFIKSPTSEVVYRTFVYEDACNWCINNKTFVKHKEVKLSKVDVSTLENKIILLHGSDHIVKKPIFGKGSLDCDYGRGFYCVEEKYMELAKEWAYSKFNKTGKGYVNKYEINLDGLKILYLNNLNILYWIAITTRYRKLMWYKEESKIIQEKYDINMSEYDIIVGWRCDDTYSDIIERLLSKSMSLEALSEAIKAGCLQNQVVLKSALAFERIKFIDSEYIKEAKKYSNRFNKRIENANKLINSYVVQYRNGTYIDDYLG